MLTPMQPIIPNDYSPEVAQLIPPFPASGKVTYRLLLDTGGHMDAINERNEVVPRQRVNGQPTSITAQTLIYDPYKQTNVTINVSTSSRVQGQGANQYLAPVLGYLDFNELGDMELTQAQMAKYRLMELAPFNKNNVLTGVDAKDENGVSRTSMPDNGWKVIRVEPDKTAKELANNQRITDKIRGIIGHNTYSANQAIARRLTGKLRFDSNVSEDMLYSLLRDAAEKDPEQVFRATTDETGKLEAVVNQAITGNLIAFDHLTRTWSRTATAQKIIEIPSGEPQAGLIAWLFDEQGAASRNWLKAAVAEATNAAEKVKPKNDEPIPEGMKRGPFGRLVPVTATAE